MTSKKKQQILLKAEIEKLKDELRQERAIRRVTRSIALAEEQNFTVIVCKEPVQARAVLSVIEEDVADMREELVKVLRYSFKRENDGQAASFHDLIAQILEPLFYWDDKESKNTVFAIDASDVEEQDEEAWLIFFQRMNEVRNTVMNRLPGPLLLLLPPGLDREFATRAPDFWSVCSLFVQAEATLTESEPLQRYKRKMKERYGTMHIWRMGSEVDLEGIFTKVNLLSTPSAFCQTPKEQLEKMFRCEIAFGDHEKKGIDGLKAVQETEKLFIFGKSGAGKTTFLKYATLKAIDGTLNYIPIFIPLRSFSESDQSIFDFIVGQFEIFDYPEAGSFIESLLKEGKAVILCDGLDEVNKEKGLRNRVIQELIDFSKKFDKDKYVITCRVAVSEYQFEDFTYVEMADFDDQQIKAFVYKWFTGKSQIADNFLKEFEEARNKRIRDLTQNPLLLTLLCIGYEETLTFPSHRSEIYEEAIDALLRKWDISRRIKRDEIYNKLSLGRKRQMFARIAYETFEKGEYLFEQKELAEKVVAYLRNLPPADTEEDIDSIAIIKAIEAQHGIFVERAQKIYSFAHLTFQEYYTAKYIVSHIHKGVLTHLIQNHFIDESWWEVFILTAEMLDDADEFFEIFIKAREDFAIKNEIFSIKTEKEFDKEKLTKKETKKILQYLGVTKLLIDCLESAYISDRQAIKDRLLRPPQKRKIGWLHRLRR
ncbi:MAG: NACHT domain-containing protein [Desulfobacteraceae bacterium]|nr:NACHT domain-containing protein [Desulfobacteraceae bacterium]